MFTTLSSNYLELLGFAAGALVTVSLLPQVIKSWRTKSTGDIALLWILINALGQLLWIGYGIGIGSMPLMIMSGVTLLLTLVLIYLKIVLSPLNP